MELLGDTLLASLCTSGHFLSKCPRIAQNHLQCRISLATYATDIVNRPWLIGLPNSQLLDSLRWARRVRSYPTSVVSHHGGGLSLSTWSNLPHLPNAKLHVRGAEESPHISRNVLLNSSTVGSPNPASASISCCTPRMMRAIYSLVMRPRSLPALRSGV